MSGYYERTDLGFCLFESENVPAWRRPQLAALGAVTAQWSLAGGDRPLVSVPTGVGKTAIALAAPFIAGARRVLVVVPTRELRRQTVEQFKSQRVLRTIGALAESSVNGAAPIVVEASGRAQNWEELQAADVVVGIPSSISPSHHSDSPPPKHLFDLVIVDEAHHTPAATWLAILEHFQAKSLLLTATPHRRDRKRIPGALVYYYPLRQALDESLYQPVEPIVLDVPDGATRDEIDALVAAETVETLRRPEHASSQFLVRARTKDRAERLAELYGDLGQEIPVLHSGYGQRRQRAIVDDLRAGVHRGVAMVGMLVEGFDLPSLRIAAYHDKHKSLEPTAQLVGRLARVDPDHPQRSVLITARDIDIYPHLVGAVRQLYEEDRDWAVVLPGIIDGFVEEDLENIQYARSFDQATGEVDLAQIHPLRRAKILEVDPGLGWRPSYFDGALPDGLAIGEQFAGQRIMYAGTNPDHTTLLIITGERVRPRWNANEALDSMEFDLHIVSFRQANRVDQPDLLLVNSKRGTGQTALTKVVGAEGVARSADANRVQAAFDGLERLSVSSVGVRNTYGATRGIPIYKMFAGSGIESGLRDADTAQASLGHAMVQVAGEDGAFTAGVSTGKSKYWETRYTPLRQYESFVADLADRYWFPPAPPSGPLLPQINRGSALAAWPDSEVLAVTMDYAVLGAEWVIDGGCSIDFVDLFGGRAAVEYGAPPSTSTDRIPLAAVAAESGGETLVWTGELDLLGAVHPTSPDIQVRRGFGNAVRLSDLLAERPPTLFFLNGVAVRGSECFAGSQRPSGVPSDVLEAHHWLGVDIRSESRAKAAERGVGVSVHQRVEELISQRQVRGRHRWILINDGSGEIADHIVVETLENGQIAIDLWHSKFAGGGAPGVRVTDLEVVTAQAIKSRRWPTDRSLWSHLAARLRGDEHPRAELVEGHRRKLEVLLGLQSRWGHFSLTRRRPSVVAAIVIVQPGLSLAQLQSDYEAGTTSAVQIAQLLTVFKDAVLSVARPSVVLSP